MRVAAVPLPPPRNLALAGCAGSAALVVAAALVAGATRRPCSLLAGVYFVYVMVHWGGAPENSQKHQPDLQLSTFSDINQIMMLGFT